MTRREMKEFVKGFYSPIKAGEAMASAFFNPKRKKPIRFRPRSQMALSTNGQLLERIALDAQAIAGDCAKVAMTYSVAVERLHADD